MLGPILIPNKPFGLFFLILDNTFSDPELLKPNLLISASSSSNRNTLGFSFPNCLRGVTVPTSTNPNPKLKMELYTSASLSKPAAIPTGLGIFFPKISISIDLFLIGIVLLIFGFGIYELFVGEIDFANSKFTDSTLKIRDLDQLKNKIIKVIIIVLIVKFFEKVLKFSENFTTPMDILYFGLSILSICVGYYLINRK